MGFEDDIKALQAFLDDESEASTVASHRYQFYRSRMGHLVQNRTRGTSLAMKVGNVVLAEGAMIHRLNHPLLDHGLNHFVEVDSLRIFQDRLQLALSHFSALIDTDNWRWRMNEAFDKTQFVEFVKLRTAITTKLYDFDFFDVVDKFRPSIIDFPKHDPSDVRKEILAFRAYMNGRWPSLRFVAEYVSGTREFLNESLGERIKRFGIWVFFTDQIDLSLYALHCDRQPLVFDLME